MVAPQPSHRPSASDPVGYFNDGRRLDAHHELDDGVAGDVARRPERSHQPRRAVRPLLVRGFDRTYPGCMNWRRLAVAVGQALVPAQEDA